MVSLPAPLNWNTLSEAFCAPPPITWYFADDALPLKVAASAGFFEGIFYESPSVPLAAAKSPVTDSVLSALLASAE
jgi:hypothetical protein